jgi:hypothetical protein
MSMTDHKIFIDRRSNNSDRRVDKDPCKDLPIDIYHRKRRKNPERRHPARTLADDYMAYLGGLETKSSH